MTEEKRKRCYERSSFTDLVKNGRTISPPQDCLILSVEESKVTKKQEGFN